MRTDLKNPGSAAGSISFMVSEALHLKSDVVVLSVSVARFQPKSYILYYYCVVLLPFSGFIFILFFFTDCMFKLAKVYAVLYKSEQETNVPPARGFSISC